MTDGCTYLRLSEEWLWCCLIFRQDRFCALSQPWQSLANSNNHFFFYVIHFCLHESGFCLVFSLIFKYIDSESYKNSNFSVCMELLRSINVDKFAFSKMLMLLFFKYVLPILVFFFLFSKCFQPLKVVDPDHPLAALVRKAQSDNNSSTPQSTDGAAVQTSQAEYSSDCKCFVRRQLVVCFDELCVDAGGKRIRWLRASSCVFILFQSPESLKVCAEYLLNCCLGKPGMGWRGWAGRRPSLQFVSLAPYPYYIILFLQIL